MARLDPRPRYHPPFDAMLVAADACSNLLERGPADLGPQSRPGSLGGLDALQEAVDCLRGISPV